jgi:hypothetical protein
VLGVFEYAWFELHCRFPWETEGNGS